MFRQGFRLSFIASAVCASFVVITTPTVPCFSQQQQPDTLHQISVVKDRDASSVHRLKIIEHLGAIRSTDPAVISALIGCFSDPDPFINGTAAASLGQIGGAAVQRLIEALQDPNGNVRWCAAIALGKIAHDAEAAIPFLVKSLNDSSNNVRWCSAIALGRMGRNAAVAAPALRSLLMDGDEDVRWSAYYALGKIGDAKAGRRLALQGIVAIADSLLPELISEYHVPGVSIAVIDNRRVAWTKSYGLSNSQTSEKVTNQTLFEACSMSKPAFAYLAMQLADKKILDLDRPLWNYLPEQFVSTGEYDKKITARMILSHTAGFPNWRMGEEEVAGPLPIYFSPGKKFSYSGEGFYYLQRVIETLTRKPLDELAESSLFRPLGLNHMSFSWNSQMALFQSSGHDTSGHPLTKTRYVHPNAAYTLYTSAEDYASFICSLLNLDRSGDHLLSKESVREMTSHHVRVDIREPIKRPGEALGLEVYWGLGWAVDSTMSGNIVYHSGANRSGFRCYSQFNMNEGSGIVVMTNGLNGSDLWRQLVARIGDF